MKYYGTLAGSWIIKTSFDAMNLLVHASTIFEIEGENKAEAHNKAYDYIQQWKQDDYCGQMLAYLLKFGAQNEATTQNEDFAREIFRVRDISGFLGGQAPKQKVIERFNYWCEYIENSRPKKAQFCKAIEEKYKL